MQIAQLGYTQEKSLSTQLTHADGPVGIYTGEVNIYSTHACRWPSWDIAQVKSIYTQLTHADGPVGIYTGEVIIYSTHACRWPSWDIHRRSHYLLNSRMQMAQLGYAQEKSLSTQLTHEDWDMHKWSHYLLNSRMQMAQLGYTQVKSLSTQLTHADGPVGIYTSEVNINSTHACRWPSWDMHRRSHYLLNSRMQMAQLGYILNSRTSWDIHRRSHYLLNSRMQMAQLGYTQEKSLSTQLTHADGPVGIYTSEVIIYSTHACRWPSWDIHKWSHYLLNSRMQMAQLGYTQEKSLSTQLTHADGPGIWDYPLNSQQTAQLGYTQEKSLSTQLTHADGPLGICTGSLSTTTQLTHADGPVGICTSEVIIYSTHACRWPSWDIHKWSHYLLNSRMQMAQLGYTQVKSLSTQLTHADGPVGIYTSEVIIYSTHACRWPSWDIHKWEVIIYSTHACRWPSWDMHK